MSSSQCVLGASNRSAAEEQKSFQRRPTADSGSWHSSPRRQHHESDGIRVSYPTLPAALTSATDLCHARPARWADHLLSTQAGTLASSACVQVNRIAERADLHQICVPYIVVCPGRTVRAVECCRTRRERRGSSGCGVAPRTPSVASVALEATSGSRRVKIRVIVGRPEGG